MHLTLSDAAPIAERRTTRDGYLVASARAARTGVQLYAGAEVGKPEMAVVRVYRPPEEVFARDSLHSYGHKPITVGHPASGVTSATWKRDAVGHIDGDIVPDGEHVRIPLMLADATAIGLVEGGTRELSVGYTCDLDWTPGITPSGESFDARQVTIRVNHVALVERGRAGSQCRIGDSAPALSAAFLAHLPSDTLVTLNSIASALKTADPVGIRSAAQTAQRLGDDFTRKAVAGDSHMAQAARYVRDLQDRALARVATLTGAPAGSITKDTTMDINDSVQRLPQSYHSKVFYALANLKSDTRMVRDAAVEDARHMIRDLRQPTSFGDSALLMDADSGSRIDVAQRLEEAVSRAEARPDSSFRS